MVRWLTIVDVQRLLHVPEATIQRWIREGNLPCTEHKGKYFFDRETLLSWARSKQIHVEQTFRKSRQVKNIKVSSCDDLLNAMRRGGLLQLKEQHSKTSLIRNACNYLPFPVGIRERVIDQITQREALSSTGLGNGIAIPHPRIPMKLELEESLIVADISVSVTLILIRRMVSSCLTTVGRDCSRVILVSHRLIGLVHLALTYCSQGTSSSQH